MAQGSRRASPGAFSIRIHSAVNVRYPYVDTFYVFNLGVIDSSAEIPVTLGRRIPLLVSAVFDDREEVPREILELHQDCPPRIDPGGSGVLQFRFLETSAQWRGRSFRLWIRPADPNERTVAEAYSSVMTVVYVFIAAGIT